MVHTGPRSQAAAGRHSQWGGEAFWQLRDEIAIKHRTGLDADSQWKAPSHHAPRMLDTHRDPGEAQRRAGPRHSEKPGP